MRMTTCLIAVFAIPLLSLGGCGTRNPVAEVTVSESGITVSAPAEVATAQSDWPQWRGPNVNGIATDQAPVTIWNEQTNIRWRTEIPGRGHSSPIVVGDTIYLATAKESEQQQVVMAFDRFTGIPKWNQVVHQDGFPAAKLIHQKATNANGTIACDGNRLYINFFNSGSITASALDLNGNMVWQRELGKYVCRFGYAPSPILYKSLVIFAADNPGGGYIAALDSETGNIAWRIARGNEDNYSSPTVANVGGRDQLLISGCGAVTSFDPATGEQNWRTEIVSKITCGTIVTTSDRIFAGGGFPKNETICLSADGKKLWSNNTKVYEPSMIVAGDRLVAVSDDGIAYCWSIDDGQQYWRKRLGGNFSASPILCGDTIYASNLKGDTFVFRAGDDYESVSRNPLGNDCYASPAVSNGQIFLRVGVGKGDERREQLVCISEPDAA